MNHPVLEKIDHLSGLDKLDSIPSLAIIERTVTVKPSIIALGITSFSLLLLLIGYGSLSICILGYVLPAYFTFLSLESADTVDDVKYLTYWILFSSTEVLTPLLTAVIGGYIWTI